MDNIEIHLDSLSALKKHIDSIDQKISKLNKIIDVEKQSDKYDFSLIIKELLKMKDNTIDILKYIDSTTKFIQEFDNGTYSFYNSINNSNSFVPTKTEVYKKNEELLNEIKGKNHDIGAIKSLNTSSIYSFLKQENAHNKLIDLVKGNKFDIVCDKSTNVESIMLNN